MSMPEEETVVFLLKRFKKFVKNGEFVEMPDNWEFVSSGDPALTRRLKANSPDYWVVKQKFGRKIFGIGLCVPKGIAEEISQQLKTERETPEYQRKLDAGRKRREKKQEQYQKDFEKAVLDFLAFHPRWQELAEKFARRVTLFTTPVGSGTVARTETIPIENRARAAVIAWMRHNLTDYDHMHIPHEAGKRREVRRELAQISIMLLDKYRRGEDAPPLLQDALNTDTDNEHVDISELEDEALSTENGD